METLDSSSSAQTASSPVRDFIKSVARFLRDERQYRHLDDLPDHLLKDVGLDRADVAAARKANWAFWSATWPASFK